MIGINEIISKLTHHTPLSLEEKIHNLRYKNVNSKVLKYLKNILKGLYIEILGDDEGTILELMSSGLLEGWCWQTTESAIIFFNDDDYIERGDLDFGFDYPEYYHSWISFKFENTEYVFDPCLNIICHKKDYYQAFSIVLKGKVSSHDVKTELIKQINMSKEEAKKDSKRDASTLFWQRYLEDYYKEYQRSKVGEVVIHGPEDVNAPFYRNGVGYKSEIEQGQIKKLIAHYYYDD